MKFHELIKLLDPLQDKVSIVFPGDNEVKQTFYSINDVPITYCNYEVIGIYGYDAEGYDGIEISVVEV